MPIWVVTVSLLHPFGSQPVQECLLLHTADAVSQESRVSMGDPWRVASRPGALRAAPVACHRMLHQVRTNTARRMANEREDKATPSKKEERDEQSQEV